MADGVTPILGLVKPEIDGSPDTWGDKWNNNWDLLDDAVVARIGGRFVGMLHSLVTGSSTAPTATLNAWADFPITTEVLDPASEITLASNIFTPSVGGLVEWEIQAHCDISVSASSPTSFFKSRLYDVTAAAAAADGQADYLASPAGEYWYNLHSRGVGPIIAAHQYKIQYFLALPTPTGIVSRLGIPDIGATYRAAFGDRISGVITLRT